MNNDSTFNKIRTIFGKFYRLGLINNSYIYIMVLYVIYGNYYSNLNVLM